MIKLDFVIHYHQQLYRCFKPDFHFVDGYYLNGVL